MDARSWTRPAGDGRRAPRKRRRRRVGVLRPGRPGGAPGTHAGRHGQVVDPGGRRDVPQPQFDGVQAAVPGGRAAGQPDLGAPHVRPGRRQAGEVPGVQVVVGVGRAGAQQDAEVPILDPGTQVHAPRVAGPAERAGGGGGRPGRGAPPVRPDGGAGLAEVPRQADVAVGRRAAAVADDGLDAVGGAGRAGVGPGRHAGPAVPLGRGDGRCQPGRPRRVARGAGTGGAPGTHAGRHGQVVRRPGRGLGVLGVRFPARRRFGRHVSRSPPPGGPWPGRTCGPAGPAFRT